MVCDVRRLGSGSGQGRGAWGPGLVSGEASPGARNGPRRASLRIRRPPLGRVIMRRRLRHARAIAVLWAALCAEATGRREAAPFRHVPSLLSAAECEALVAAAHGQGLRPSLKPERALDPMPLLAALDRPPETLDLDGDGVVDSSEAAVAVRSVLNAPLFAAEDASAWLLASVGTPSVSVSSLPQLRTDVAFTSATRRFFAELFAASPEKFSRLSEQAPLSWQQLRAENATRSVARRVAALTRVPEREVAAGEPLQVIRYGPGGHYSAHSDSGWPGHRPLSVLIYLRAPGPGFGGETCFVSEAALQAPAATAGYAQRCARVLEAAGSTCFTPARGDALVWANVWETGETGGLQVPGAHAACPVLPGGGAIGPTNTKGSETGLRLFRFPVERYPSLGPSTWSCPTARRR